MLAGMLGTSASLTRSSIWPGEEESDACETALRWWTSQELRARPYLWHHQPQAPGSPPIGGGSRRSLLPPPWPVGRVERSASPLVGAPLWGGRLAGCSWPT